MSKSLNINVPQIVQTRDTLNAVPSGSTATPDYSVKYVPQDLTEAQKAQARQNIGAAAEGEGGGSTINEFVYTRTGNPGEYAGVISCEGYEPKEGDVMIISFTGPFYLEYNPVTLNNGTTNPTVTLLNAEVNATDYDEINPEVNTKWTVRLTKVDNAWVAVNISTQVQPDWNTVDSTMPSYIKNKPTISSKNDIPDEYRGVWKIHFQIPGNRSGYADWQDNLSRVINTWQRGVEQGSSNRRLLTGWNEIQFIDDAREHVGNFDMSNEAINANILVKTFEADAVMIYNFNPSRKFNGKVDVFIYPVAGRDNRYWKTWGSGNLTAHNVKFYCMTNVWPAGWDEIYADIVYVDGVDFASVPDQTYTVPSALNTPGIWVPNSKKADYLTFLTTTYPNEDISVFTNNTIYYDFITWIDDHTPQVVTLPSLALTMTDATGNTIDGDFVAQNITITPAV